MADTPDNVFDAAYLDKKRDQVGIGGRRLARSTLIVMVAFAIAKVISLGQTVVIANVFGVGTEWDTFVTANRIPELIFTLNLWWGISSCFHSYLYGFSRQR